MKDVLASGMRGVAHMRPHIKQDNQICNTGCGQNENTGQGNRM